MSKFRVITLKTKVWNTDVVVFLGGSAKQHERTFKSHEIKKDVRNYWHERIDILRKSGGGFCGHEWAQPWYVFIYLPKKPSLKDAGDIEQVTHELLHAAIHILRKKAVTLCPESEESYTYLFGFLVREFFKRL